MSDDFEEIESEENIAIDNDEEIVSVNDKGRRDSNTAAKVTFLVVVLAVGFVAILYGVTRYGGDKGSTELADNRPGIVVENKKASVANARSFTDAPPELLDDPVSQQGANKAEIERSGQLVGSRFQSEKNTGDGAERSRYGGKIITESLPSTTNIASGTNSQTASVAQRKTVADQALDTLKEIARNAQGGGDKPPTKGNVGGGKNNLGGSLESSGIGIVKASKLPNLDMVIAKGKQVNCILTSRIVSQLPGFVSCTLDENVYSENGKVLLWEKGSVATGEYEGGISDGQDSIFVMWDRVRTPSGVTMNFNSPGTDSLGTSGIPGHVNGRWMKRIGGAFMLSIFKDAVGFYTAKEAGGGSLGTEAYSNTLESGDKFAEKILEKTINMGPLLIKNHGDRIAIFVARDLDFSNVYEVVKR